VHKSLHLGSEPTPTLHLVTKLQKKKRRSQLTGAFQKKYASNSSQFSNMRKTYDEVAQAAPHNNDHQRECTVCIQAPYSNLRNTGPMEYSSARAACFSSAALNTVIA